MSRPRQHQASPDDHDKQQEQHLPERRGSNGKPRVALAALVGPVGRHGPELGGDRRNLLWFGILLLEPRIYLVESIVAERIFEATPGLPRSDDGPEKGHVREQRNERPERVVEGSGEIQRPRAISLGLRCEEVLEGLERSRLCCRRSGKEQLQL